MKYECDHWEYMMCEDVQTIRIIPSEEQLEWARDYSEKDFKYYYRRFNGGKDRKFAGMVGERCFGDHYNLEVREWEPTETVTLMGHDMVMGNFLIDSKATQCHHRPLIDFKVAIRKEQMSNRNDIFGLSFYNAPSNILTICGWATKSRIYSHGMFQDKDEKDERSAGCRGTFKAEYPTWKIRVCDMYELKYLERFCGEWSPKDIQKWDEGYDKLSRRKV